MFIKGIAIFLSSCRNVGAELIISKRATQSYFWVTLQRSVLQHPANRGMSLATREQKDVTTDFALCRAFGPLRDKGHDRATTKRIKGN